MPIGKDGRMYPDRKGAASATWKGGLQKSGNGAIQTVAHGNPRADVRGRMYEHVLVAERALGHALPAGAVVHHQNRDRTDNRPENLVVCESQAYHLLVHRRLRAYRACGHADWFRCHYCKQWDAPTNLYVNLRQHQGPDARHRACHARAVRARHVTLTR